MNKSNDISLIQRIAARRDESAFEELLRRHQRMLFTIALRFTGRVHLAEDAVQRAMLRVWLGAGAFRESGSVRGWLISILNNECSKILRSLRTRKNHVEQGASEELVDSRTLHVEPERKEMLEAVRSQFARLTMPQRQVITLRYCSDLSQREIGEILKIPQRTVSDHLNKALVMLREKLCRTGMASAVSLLTASEMKEALESGFELPSSLQGRILENVAGDANAHQVIALPRVSTRLSIMGGVLVTLSLAGGLLAWTSSAPENSGEGNSDLAEPSRALAVEPGSFEVKTNGTSASDPMLTLPQKWDFQNGAPDDLQLVDGSWAWWAPDRDHKGAMVFDVSAVEKDCSLFVLNRVLPTRSLLITLTSRGTLGAGIGELGVYWANKNKDRLLPQQSWISLSNSGLARELETHRIYVHGNVILGFHKDQINFVRTYAEPLEDARLCFAGDNFILQDIRIEKLLEEDLPAQLRNPEGYLREIKSDPKFQKGTLERDSSIKGPFRSRREPDQWDFSKGVPTSWRIMSGLWSIDKKTKTLQVPPKKKKLVVALPRRCFTRPFSLKIHAELLDPRAPGSLDCYYFVDAGLLPYTRKKSFSRKSTASMNRSFVLEAYFIGRHVLCRIGNEVVFIGEHENPYRTDRVGLAVWNLGVRSVSLQELEPDQIPEAFRNPDALLRRLDGKRNSAISSKKPRP